MTDENLYRVRAERGEVQIGTWVNMIRTPSVLALLPRRGPRLRAHRHGALAVLDGDRGRHGGARARSWNSPMVVRPPEGNREWITRLLDAGVWNLHVPAGRHARAGASRSRRPAATRRWASEACTALGRTPSMCPRAAGRAHSPYANARVHVTAMLESKRAFAQAGRDRRDARNRRADDRPDRSRPGSRGARYARARRRRSTSTAADWSRRRASTARRWRC